MNDLDHRSVECGCHASATDEEGDGFVLFGDEIPDNEPPKRELTKRELQRIRRQIKTQSLLEIDSY